ncbi:hypothetical protein [Streptomyces huasconensis]|uniref:hypothetical protein n=1 Tax=Streptomyces huasconensis TaxID=1854574 RepID=UPI0033E1FB94
MTVLPFADVFASLAHWVETCCSNEFLCLHDGDCTEAPEGSCLPVNTLQMIAQRSPHESARRSELWRAVARSLEAEAERDQKGRWVLIALWVLAPRLKGAVRTIARRTGAEASDVCSAALIGVIEGTRTIRAVGPDEIEEHLLDTACAAGWKAGRRGAYEVLDAEVEDRPARPPLDEPATTFVGDQLIEVGTMSLALAQRVQGERLGALAQRLGLMQHVREVRRLGRAGLGANAGAADRGAREKQQWLFEMGGNSDETAP